MRTVRPTSWSRLANGPLMARTVHDDPRLVRSGLAESPLTCGYVVERVTGIEPAPNPHYQLGNLCRPGPSCGLTCGAGCPWVTVRDRSSPGLMAR